MRKQNTIFSEEIFSHLIKNSGVKHKKFGNLIHSKAVDMSRKAFNFEPNYFEDENIMIHLTVTGKCYANCRGCINSVITLGVNGKRNEIVTFQETEPERDAKIILYLAEKYPNNPLVICFYGGEPFLSLDKMVKVQEILSKSNKCFKYTVYTNGELLIKGIKKYPEFMKSIWIYSVSIDGDEKQHNEVRPGTDYKRIIKNLKELANIYKGNVLHWATLREEQSLLNCFETFVKLYNEGLVNHFFWHWIEAKNPFKNFHKYIIKYEREFEKIMDIYLKEISKGRILPIAHLNELTLYFLTGKERGHTACGVELSKNYDIVNGKVFPCADLSLKQPVGELDRQGILRLKDYNFKKIIEYKKYLKCYDCGIHSYCGGRCPVQVLAGSIERTLQYCQLMRLHVGIVQDKIEKIASKIKENKITLKEIYEKSAFITKYTDVVP